MDRLQTIAHQNHNPAHLPDELFRAFDMRCPACGLFHIHLYPSAAVQSAGRLQSLRFVCPAAGHANHVPLYGRGFEIPVDHLLPSATDEHGDLRDGFVVDVDHRESFLPLRDDAVSFEPAKSRFRDLYLSRWRDLWVND